MNYLLYGAYGFTGRLMAELSAAFGLAPTLAGRRAEKLEPLAKKYKRPYLTFDLEDEEALVEHLKPFDLVLHAAGPFSQTAEPMIRACLRAKTHYLDITGELAVFELAHSYDAAAREAGVLLMSGTGFDVVPTDCTAKLLHEALPDATHLELGIASLGGQVSHGTAQTVLESLGAQGAVRENGKVVPRPVGHKTQWVTFGTKRRFTMTIPWGDIATAYYTTGIPNIEVYMAVPPSAGKLMPFQSFFNPLLRLSFVKDMLKSYVSKNIEGPSAAERATARSLVWGRVRNAEGVEKIAHFEGPEGYTFTAKMALRIAQKVLQGEAKAGYFSPAGLFGSALATEIDDCTLDYH